MSVNVNRENPDQFYRYKMPLLIVKVIGDFHYYIIGQGSCGFHGCVFRLKAKEMASRL